jgi:alpha-amylase
MERTYQRSYLPFVECVARHPRIRLGLHYSGSLLEWLAEKHPEYMKQIGALVASGQVEITGGGFYEPILVTIPFEDQVEQIKRLSDFVEERFGKRPSGAWLAERVWEPQLPVALAEAGVDYTLVDDSHFLTAGREIAELFGYYICEDRGSTVKIIPGLKDLRYLLPFGSVDDAMGFLRRSADEHPGGMASMGDDMEKFGAWPHTWEHCFRDGWLDNFFASVESNDEWLETLPPGEALAARPPVGRVDLPTASYTEMMEWVLPTPVRKMFHALQEEFAGRPDVRRFLRGGFWRGFFSKYSESNLLHKKMLRVSWKLRHGGPKGARKSAKGASLRAAAITQMLRAQCNDPYWHGIFGGLYAPHLRTEPWRGLVRAETIADGLNHPAKSGAKPYQELTRLDFDRDGREEIEITSPKFAAVIRPSDGGTVEVLDFRPSAVTLINSLQRRVEAYHSRLQNTTAPSDGVVSIHNQTISKEAGLEKYLKYDRWARNAFRLLLFANGKNQSDFEGLGLDETAAFAGGEYRVEQATPQEVKLAARASLSEVVAAAGVESNLCIVKTLTFQAQERGFDVTCRVELVRSSAGPNSQEPSGAVQFMAGIEIVLNLLAPNVPDRYFEFHESRKPLEWSGAVEGSKLRVVDEWQNVSVDISAPGANQIWIAPIETVSESEEGFERVYQGSQILAVWPVEVSASESWNAEAVVRVTQAR